MAKVKLHHKSNVPGSEGEPGDVVKAPHKKLLDKWLSDGSCELVGAPARKKVFGGDALPERPARGE